jgi:hypothetical protein
MRNRLAVLLLAIAAAAPCSAFAEQQLIPAPYPSADDSARFSTRTPSYHHQRLVPTPYPNSLGPNARGNPGITTTRRHQRLVPPPYPRRYR